MHISHRSLLAVVAVIAVAAVAGIALLWPERVVVDDDPFVPDQDTRLVDAQLIDVVELGEDEFGLVPGATEVAVSARIEETGEVVSFEMIDDTGDTFAAGQRVKLQEISGADGEVMYLVSDFRRDWPLIILFGLFLTAVIAFSRWQGVRALVGLALTFVIIVGFIVPAILGGQSPVAVALVGAVVIMILTLYLAHGYSPKTTAAVVGTALALLLTGALAVAFVAAANLTGFTSEEARLANLEVGGLSLRGLLLAGIIIGGLGVLDDVTMSQSSTVFELRRANPRAGFGDLLRGALNVGRDHIAATVNTLFLAYAGASLPLLILFVTADTTVTTVLTAEIVAVEVVRTLVGSIGLIAAVPLTTALAAAVVGAGLTARRGPAQRPEPAPGREPRPVREPASDGDDAAGTPISDEPAPDDEDDDEWVGRLREAYRLPDREADT